MRQVQIASDNTRLFLHSSPFARGGEGLLYEVMSPKEYKGFVVKMYHPEKRSSLRAQKIAYLVANAPLFAQDATQCPVAWPLAAINEKGVFAGFLMRKVAGKSLEILCTPKLPKGLDAGWQRFDFSRPEARLLRQKVCFNLAVALQHIHATQHYTFIDLKPDNILIQPNGLLSLVDMDSIEVSENGVLRYPAPVATPDYTPPEHYTQENAFLGNRETWDRFSMAVIFYKVLLGLHPYAASCTTPYEKADSLAAKIEEGLFVHHPSKNQYISVIPALHKHFEQLPTVLQDCFMQCFAYGHEEQEVRPTAEEWCWALAREVGQELRHDLSYLPFSAKLQPPTWPKLPTWLSYNAASGLTLMAKNKGERLQLHFKLHGPSIKRYFWIGKQTKEEWQQLQNQLESDLNNALDAQKWSLQEKALLAQWLLDWKKEQAEQLTFCLKKLDESQQTYKETSENLAHQIRLLNRQLAHAIQASQQQKRAAYLQLTENSVWQRFRGKSLQAKLWHLAQWFTKEQNLIKDENLSMRSSGELRLNRAMDDIEQKYYQKLKAIEEKIKEKRERTQQNIQQAYETAITQSEVYQARIAATEKQKAEYSQKLKTIQHDYSKLLADLDKQFQQQLLSVQDALKTETSANLRLFELRTQQQLLEEMLWQQQAAAARNYEEQKSKLTIEYQSIIHPPANTVSDFEKSMEMQYYKLPLQTSMNLLQQELQLLKAVEEEAYMQHRELCQKEFIRLKQHIAEKDKQLMAVLLSKRLQLEAELNSAYEKYLSATKQANEVLHLVYEQLSEALEQEKNRLQNLVALELAQLNELFHAVNTSLQTAWVNTLGETEVIS